MMSKFSDHLSSKVIALLTLLLFLNISFSAFEIHLLGLTNDAALAGIVSLILSGTCLEEERDAESDFPRPDSESSETEMLFTHQVTGHSNPNLILSDLTRSIFNHPLPNGEDPEAVIPPPELLF